MSAENKVPEIRFKGFSGEWEERELGGITSKIGSGKTPRGGSATYVFEGVPLLRSQNIYNNLVNLNDVAYITPQTHEEMKNSCVLNNDVLLNITGASIGRSAVYSLSNEANVNQHVCIIRLTEGYSSKFTQLLLASYKGQQQIDNNQAGGAREGLNFQHIGQMSFVFSPLDEQTKIGNYFQQLDTLIAQHQQKHDKLLNLKKALLEKMFPKQNATVPEIRFKGFSGEWEEKEIQEVANRYDNLRIPITAADRISGPTPYYGANGIQGYVEGHTHNGEFILVAEDGANDLKNYPVQYVNGKIWVNNHTHVLQAKNNIADNYFLKLSISHTEIEPFLVGGGRAKLNSETMMKIIIDISLDNEEQTKIGNLFKQLDTLLTQHQAQLKKLNHIKQACLEKMFV